jgi:hypothetical protein
MLVQFLATRGRGARPSAGFGSILNVAFRCATDCRRAHADERLCGVAGVALMQASGCGGSSKGIVRTDKMINGNLDMAVRDQSRGRGPRLLSASAAFGSVSSSIICWFFATHGTWA